MGQGAHSPFVVRRTAGVRILPRLRGPKGGPWQLALSCEAKHDLSRRLVIVGSPEWNSFVVATT